VDGVSLGLSPNKTNFRSGREWVFWYEHRETGEVVSVTAWEVRMRRMKHRLKTWVRASPEGLDYIVVDLTYAPEHSWRPLHISGFLAVVKKHLGKKLKGYSWVAEMQKRGAVHYHVVLAVEKGVKIPKPDKEGWWPYGMTRVRKKKKPMGYLMDYVRKVRQKQGYPKGIRIFAVVWFQWAADGDSRFLLSLWSLPGWLLGCIDQFTAILERALPHRWPGGWWCWKGRWFRSPWVLAMVA
jgi:hypothetical protein